METITTFFALCFGVLVRLALPIAVTLVLVYFLRKLDARWQAEAQLQPIHIKKPECWKIKDCPPEKQKDCIARTSPLPCWQDPLMATCVKNASPARYFTTRHCRP